MVRHSGFLALALLAIAALTVTARVGQSQTLDSDLRRVVQEWTSRCSSKEATQDPVASQCWLNAASALTRYTDGNSEPLVKEVEQLQADWLERAAQLQVPTTARIEANKSPPPDTVGGVQGSRRSSRILPIQTRSFDERIEAVVAEQPVTEPKVKNLAGTEKSTAKRSQKQASRATKKKTAPQQITSSQSKSKTKSATHTLKDRGREKEQGFVCTNLKCIIKKRRDQRAPAS
jgi:hypothetical protein